MDTIFWLPAPYLLLSWKKKNVYIQHVPEHKINIYYFNTLINITIILSGENDFCGLNISQ